MFEQLLSITCHRHTFELDLSRVAKTHQQILQFKCFASALLRVHRKTRSRDGCIVSFDVSPNGELNYSPVLTEEFVYWYALAPYKGRRRLACL